MERTHGGQRAPSKRDQVIDSQDRVGAVAACSKLLHGQDQPDIHEGQQQHRGRQERDSRGHAGQGREAGEESRSFPGTSHLSLMRDGDALYAPCERVAYQIVASVLVSA